MVKLLSVFVRPTEVTVPPAISLTQLVLPLPSVESICPAVPELSGNVNVRFCAKLAGELNV